MDSLLNVIFGRRHGVENRRWQFNKPDVVQSRAGRHLMVWGDLPYWTVVDDELKDFLEGLDGERSLGEVLTHPDYGTVATDLKGMITEFSEKGVVTAEGVSCKPMPSESSLIDNVALNLTSACNLRCRFCYARDALTKNPQNELTGPEIVSFLHKLKPSLSFGATLTILGGEPSLRSQTLFEVAEGVKSLGMSVIVSTNGQGLDVAFAKRAAETGLLVQVSLDGATKRMHDAERGTGTFEKAIKSIRLLVEHGVSTTISMVCHSGNVNQLEAYFRLGKKLGVDGVRFIPLKCIGGGADDGIEPVPLVDLFKAAATVFAKYPDYHTLAGSDALSVMAGACSLSVVRKSCGAGVKTVALNADGSVYPCLNLQSPEFRLGNLRDADFDFDAAWKGNSMADFRCKTSVDDSESPCRECPVRYWCLAGCRGENFAATGNVRSKSPTCDDQKRMIFETLWLLADQPGLAKSVTQYC